MHLHKHVLHTSGPKRRTSIFRLGCHLIPLVQALDVGPCAHLVCDHCPVHIILDDASVWRRIRLCGVLHWWSATHWIVWVLVLCVELTALLFWVVCKIDSMIIVHTIRSAIPRHAALLPCAACSLPPLVAAAAAHLRSTCPSFSPPLQLLVNAAAVSAKQVCVINGLVLHQPLARTPHSHTTHSRNALVKNTPGLI